MGRPAGPPQFSYRLSNWHPRDARGVYRMFRDIGEYQPARYAAGEAVPGLLRGYYLMLIYD